MTNPTAREVIAKWFTMTRLSINSPDSHAEELLNSLDRAGKEIVDKGAVAKERELTHIELVDIANGRGYELRRIDRPAAIRARGKE